MHDVNPGWVGTDSIPIPKSCPGAWGSLPALESHPVLSHLPGSVASLGEEPTAQSPSVETIYLIGRKSDDIKAAVPGSPASMPWNSLVALGYHEASMTCCLTSSGDRTVHSLSTLGGRRPRLPARARDGFSSKSLPEEVVTRVPGL